MGSPGKRRRKKSSGIKPVTETVAPAVQKEEPVIEPNKETPPEPRKKPKKKKKSFFGK